MNKFLIKNIFKKICKKGEITGVCSDHFFDPPLSEIKLEILILYESPYFSHNPCEILRLNYVSLKRYDQNSRELLEKLVTKINIV